jgi:hypothetical protein
MDATIPTVARDSSSGFLLRWLGAWMLATALSSFLLAVFYVLDERYRARPAIYVGIIGALSLPAVGGLLHGFVMRGLLRRSTLWGALTGGGIAIAAMTVVFMTLSVNDLWWPLQSRLALWVAHTFGLAVSPFYFVRWTSASVPFGLILGVMQAIVLAPRWWSVATWIAISTAAAVLTGLWLYAWTSVEPVSSLFSRMAGLMPLTGEWRYLPTIVLWAEVAALCFALPTGLFMQRLLRRHRRADAEALVRRFE